LEKVTLYLEKKKLHLHILILGMMDIMKIRVVLYFRIKSPLLDFRRGDIRLCRKMASTFNTDNTH